MSADKEGGGMVGLLVVTHGRFAEELVASARTIVGELAGLEAVSIEWNDDADEATGRIREGIAKVDQGRGVLVLTDMFGGTPTNLALSMLEPGKVEIVTGVNLPMLIKFANLPPETELQDAAGRVARQARESVQVATELLEAKDGTEEADGE
jgi:PTS system mannose-specific IIA component